MKLKTGDLVKIVSCYRFPELKNQIGLFVGMMWKKYKTTPNRLCFYKVLCDGRQIGFIKNDLEVINESKSNET